VERGTLDPHSLGTGPIGHIGYFRPQADELWRKTLEWFRTPLAASPMS
jgi:predicted alpha/beta hydrolase